MVSAAVEAIVTGSTDVLVTFPYTLKIPKDFPRGVLEEKTEDGGNVHRIKARKLLKWLNDRGHTEISAEMLRGEIISFGIEASKMDAMFEEDEQE